MLLELEPLRHKIDYDSVNCTKTTSSSALLYTIMIIKMCNRIVDLLALAIINPKDCKRIN